MNIFILDRDLDKCAEYHIDKHVVKMPLEAAQMLCTTHWIDTYLGYVPRKLWKEELAILRKCKHPENVTYAVAMANHPCTIWTRSSLDNYEWLFCYALALNEEYGFRYGKSHKSVYAVANSLPNILHIPRDGLTQFVQAMPESCKRADPVEAYRFFYHKDKAPFASWKYREKPYWWDETEANYDRRITA